MLRPSLLWTVALAGTTIAVPHIARRSSSLPTPSTPVTSTSASCTAGDTSSTEGVQAILDSTGTNNWLDKQLETLGGEDDWVDKLWERVFPNQGTSPLSGCGTVGSNCVPDDMCGNYPNEQAYWTFTAVGMLHSKINYVHDKILWTGWLDGLSIDQISKDFSQPPPDTTWIKWLAAAMTIASGFGTGVDWSKGLRGMIGMAGGSLTEVSTLQGQDGGDDVDTTSVENTLKNYMGSAGDYLSAMLANATGNGDSDYLPTSADNTLYTYGTSKFFEDPSILLAENKDNSSFVAAFDGFSQNVEKKLVDVAMKSAWYVLLMENDASESDCDYYTNSMWLEYQPGKSGCFYLTRPQTSQGCDNDDPSTCEFDVWETPWDTHNAIDSDVYTKLTDNYGYDLEAYYNSLIDCNFNGNGEVDMTATTDNGAIPRCFYSLYVRSGTWQQDPSTPNSYYYLTFQDW